jgi:hypothetical protein
MTQPIVNPSSADAVQGQLQEPDEISLIDILHFLRRRFRVIGAVTLATAALGIGASLLNPTQFRREILLDFEILSTLEHQGLSVNENEVEAIAALELESHIKQHQANLGGQAAVSGTVESATLLETSDSPTYLRLTMRSADSNALESVRQSAYDRLQEVTNTTVSQQVDNEVERLDALIQRTQQKIAFLEERAEVPSANIDPRDASNLLYLLQLQQQQAALNSELNTLDNLKFNRETLALTQNQGASLVQIVTLSDIETQQSSPLMRNIILSIIVGSMMGILIAIVIDQIPQIRKKLSEA